MPHKLILLDGSAFLFRAYFSTLKQNLSNQEGFPTGAIFGVINAIKRLQNQYPQAKLIAIFDAKGKNFRHDIYPQYKAHRKPAEDDLIIQIEPLYEIIQAMGFHFICVSGVEADDVIATLSRCADQNNIKTMIASGDKDLMQLVSPNISQLDMKGGIYDRQNVIEKMGVAPEKILDLLALTGDSADNIPGVPSVGPKTAVKWLELYKGLEGIKNNAHEIKGKVGEKLRDNFELLDLSHRLVKLKFDVELPCNILDNEPGQDNVKLASLYQQYGFSMWHRQLGDVAGASVDNSSPEQSENPEPDVSPALDLTKDYSRTTVVDESVFSQMLTRLKNAKHFVFDLETNSLDYMNAQIVGWVFLIETDSFYIPVAHDYLDAPKQLNFKQVMQALAPILEDDSIGKIGQNLKYDAHILANYKIDLNGIVDDTMVKSYVLNSVATRHNMDDLAEYYLNHQTISFSDVAGKGKKQITFNQVSLEIASPYACEDVIVTDLLNKTLDDQIAQYPKLVKLYQRVELPMVKVLVKMERNGVKLDAQALGVQQIDIKSQMQSIQTQAYELAGEMFNLESPKQIQQILFSEEGLGLEAKKKTPKGAPSTNEEALKLLDHPLVDLILSYRTLTKLNSTYLEALPKQIDTHTKRLHTSYHQAVTATGRLSSSNPNLQNIPIRSEQGARIRGSFIASEGNVIIAADYSQIELRIMAHISQDVNLLQAFKDDQDVHSATAATMFRVLAGDVTSEQRRRAKAINFGLIYGMSAFGLAKQINVSRTEAKEYIEAYFENYPGVADYMEDTRESAKIQEYVETVMGRRLYLPQINAKNKMLQQHALRTAINAPMQGSSADIIKLAMLDVAQWIGANNTDIKMIMQVHDELVFEVKADKADEFADKIKSLMEGAYALDIPLKVDVGMGDSWQQAH
ncbi:DNA polymerase I [Bathymodiolus heckerae thiotrophic gill symbiont]|uniref:DNA polymerase I n=1 Tax=Bathymodiolus heckerae thiotrophic gill symbiont TaxID=1052212 RepID=UPI0010B6CC70|nr:DNA polymerase I [Bathymodiolus heckerae thiotrophic gill symbiont]CAC9589194.1 DNA polymerase I (EC 2.7.7.7) [uncultured Gammaproteobacteria bacterium]SHN91047.1 DNA polymerase I [Bathymodiolus heckerae thiotrophic gill symbiont]